MDDNTYMHMALALAKKGVGHVSPNPMVGAVVVNDGQVVGRGYHQAVGGPHAEVHAINDAGKAARGATLYVTLEPCNHQGRTPPCTRKILEAGIQRVVVAMADPNPDVKGGGNAYLQSRGIDVVCGVAETAAQQLNESFVKYIRTKRPFVVLKMAATLDGRIATRTGDARWVTGPAARAYVHRLRHAMDAIMVGIGTAVADDPQLTARLDSGPGKDPMRVVLDSRLRMPDNARMLSQPSEADTWIVCAADASQKDKARLEAQGAHLLEVPLSADGLAMDAIVMRLGEMGITSLLIEGGGRVAASALKAKVVDKVLFFYAPKILGGDDGIPMCRGKGPAMMSESTLLNDIEVLRVGEDILISGYLHANDG